MRTLSADELRRIAAAIFRKAGSSAEEADTIAEQLVEADLVGHHSHGVVRIPAYVNQMRAGRVFPNRHASVVARFGATLIVDGNMGYGQVIGLEAVRLGIEASAEHGVALVGIRNCGHLGRLGYWAELAARAGRASLHFVSAASPGGAQIAAHGGRDRRMAANPMAFGFPVGNGPPIVLDFATSEVAVGKARVAKNRGERLPSACIVDADGNMTDDPNALFGERPGAIIPFGGHKGYALNLFNDLLGGALTGAGIPHQGEASSVQSGNNMLSILIDPRRLADPATMGSQVEDYMRWLKSSRPLAEGAPVRIPGEGAADRRAQAMEHGVRIDDTTWDQVMAVGEQLGLTATETT